jgi:hypothetical protein
MSGDRCTAALKKLGTSQQLRALASNKPERAEVKKAV